MTTTGGQDGITILPPGKISDDDFAALRAAFEALEHPGWVARLTSIAGRPIEMLRQSLPAGAPGAVTAATTKALNAAMKVALRTINNESHAGSHILHKAMAMTVGAVGGGFGLAALPFELPISTIIMLRSILDIARAEGEDIRNPETTLSCIQVFALGGRTGEVDPSEAGYFAVRGMFAKTVTEAARFIAQRGALSEGAPVLVRFISLIASRFGAIVTQKLATQAVPVIGGLGGAAVNYIFIDHFQEVGRAHFTVRRLERLYGESAIRAAYEKLQGEMKPRDWSASAAPAR